MKILLTVLTLLSLATLVFGQTSSVSMFQFHPERIEPGTVYHYTKSNLDGSKPSTVSIFIVSKDTIEVYKAEPEVIDAAHIIAKMDWNLFSASDLDSGHHLKDGTREPVARLSVSKSDNTLKVHWKDKDDSVKVEHYPVHIYNFDFISFNYTLRHLKDPTKTFEIGIADPVFQGQGLIQYKGTARIEFVGEDRCHQTACRKYKISGKAFGDKEGFMWVNKKEGYAENIEIPVPDNPEWNSFKFELKKIEKMSPDQWKVYKDSNIGRQPFP